MAQFTVNTHRFDPYKNFKFRMKWDGRYVAGVSKVSRAQAHDRGVTHREGGDPSTPRMSPSVVEVRADHARARRHPRPGLRELGQPGLQHGRRRGDLAGELPQGPHHRAPQRAGRGRQGLQGLPLLGLRVPGAARARRQRQRRRHRVTWCSRTRAGSATRRSPSRPRPERPMQRTGGCSYASRGAAACGRASSRHGRARGGRHDDRRRRRADRRAAPGRRRGAAAGLGQRADGGRPRPPARVGVRGHLRRADRVDGLLPGVRRGL